MRPGAKKNVLTPRKRGVALRFLKLLGTRRTFETFKSLSEAGQPTAPMLHQHMKRLPKFMKPHIPVLRQVRARTLMGKEFDLMRMKITRPSRRKPVETYHA